MTRHAGGQTHHGPAAEGNGLQAEASGFRQGQRELDRGFLAGGLRQAHGQDIQPRRPHRGAKGGQRQRDRALLRGCAWAAGIRPSSLMPWTVAGAVAGNPAPDTVDGDRPPVFDQAALVVHAAGG